MAEGTIDSVKNLCSVVQERDRQIREADVRIEYYKNALEKVNDEIKRIERNRRKIAEQIKFIDKENEQLEFIQNSLKFGQEVSWQSLINHQYIERLAAKELAAQEKKSQIVEKECRNLYTKAQEELKQNPLYQEFEKQKVEFLKADIQRRDLEVKIRKRKCIIAQKIEIEKRIFYNFFIELAEEYVIEKRMEELKNLKIQEIESVKRLFAVQEEVKMRQKLGTPRDKIKTMTNITFGSQDLPMGQNNLQSKVSGLPQQKRRQELSNEKLDNWFQQDECKHAVATPKVNILNQKIITPAFVVPQFAPGPAEKRKNKTVDLSCKWQKLIKHSSFSKSSSNRNQEQFSQSSQQSRHSQLSQPPVLTPEIDVVQQHEWPIKNTDAIKPLTQTQEKQGMSVNMPAIVPPFQDQMVENMDVGADQFQMKYPQVMAETSYYDHNKSDKPLTENNYTNRPTSQPQDPQRVSIQMRNKEPPVQYQAVENMNVGAEQFRMESSEVAPSTLQERRMTGAEVISGWTNPTPDVTYARPTVSVPKTDMLASDHAKSVRFNLEQTNRPTEPKFVLGGGSQSIFANLFTPFSTRGPNKNDILLQEQPAGATNNTLNFSLMEGENSPTGIEFDSDENRMRSPECTYEAERGVQQQFKPPELPSFAGGFFPFGKNLFNPF